MRKFQVKTRIEADKMYTISYDILNKKITEAKPINTNNDIS